MNFTIVIMGFSGVPDLLLRKFHAPTGAQGTVPEWVWSWNLRRLRRLHCKDKHVPDNNRMGTWASWIIMDNLGHRDEKAYCIHIWARSPDPHTPPPPPMVSPPTPNPPHPPKPSICMLFAHIHTHIHIYTPLSTPPTSHLYVICSTWEPRPRQRTLSTCIFLS